MVAVVAGVAAASALECTSVDTCNALARTLVENMLQLNAEPQTIEALAGQMTQLDINQVLRGDLRLDEAKVTAFAKLGIGSYLNSPFAGGPRGGKHSWSPAEWRSIIERIQQIHLKIDGHPILYGLDSVHGANYVGGAVVFPQQNNAAATFNRDLVRQLGYYTGRDTVAAGIPWAFGPILGVVSHKAWPRVYETFGEDPYVVTEMATQVVQGLQENHKLAACFKHFIGYPMTPTGRDRDPVTISEYDLLNVYLPPFKAAIDAGAMTGMMSYISFNGVPMGANHGLLVDLLRTTLGFQGLLVTDWGVIDDLATFHHAADSEATAVGLALQQTSIDMSMDATHTRFIANAAALVRAQKVPLERLQTSAERILALKLQLQLYSTPVPGKEYESLVGDAASQNAALATAHESIVLLQNKNSTLPLPKGATLFVTGPAMDDIGYLCGGWSLHWQGTLGNTMFLHGRTVKAALAATHHLNAWVPPARALTAAEFAEGVAMAADAEYTVAVMGEAPYAEKPGDIDDLSLPAEQLAYLRALAQTTTKLIVVLVQGRPRLLHDVADAAHAVLHAGLPGEMGGIAIADVLTGAVSPSGRLPFTYPRTPLDANTVYYHPQNQGCYSGYLSFHECAPQWAFGTGLSYATFAYDNARAVLENGTLLATVTVTNAGARRAKEAILVFVQQHARASHVPEMKRLVHFEKLDLAPGTSATATLRRSLDDLGSYSDAALRREPLVGAFTVMFTAGACEDAPHLCITIGSHHERPPVYGLPNDGDHAISTA
ncbi:glycoside hydrolase [Achlya hypogyna]|nr:glycoside hydrolase [Achlya hypogyna]